MTMLIWVWFTLTAVSTAVIAVDLFTRTPEMTVMKWGWLLVSLYTGPAALVVYWLSCREPAPGSHERFVAPLWKQSVGSTIHCLAGDATGVIVAAAVTAAFGLPMWTDSAVEYAAGFLFGLLVFQALFMKDMLGGSYVAALKKTWLAEWLSMNCVMAGMFPVMLIWMTRDMTTMEPTSARFWFVMSMATLVGAITGYPVNLWLVKTKLKHGMGTKRALGRGGAPVEAQHDMAAMESGHGAAPAPAHEMAAMAHSTGVSRARKIAVATLSVTALLAGLAIAARFGDIRMRRGAHAMPGGERAMPGGEMPGMPMQHR